MNDKKIYLFMKSLLLMHGARKQGTMMVYILARKCSLFLVLANWLQTQEVGFLIVRVILLTLVTQGYLLQ